MRWDKFKQVPKLQEFIKNEIEILTNISNPNVIRFIEMLRTQNNFYLIYEYCNGGTLEDIIKKKKMLSEKESLHIFNQILNAFQCLVKKNILHRDLKPGNIIFHNNIVKVADFGFCKALEDHNDLTQTMVGSPIYMAPEILKGCDYSIKADIWSMGVVLFEMLFGYCPYEDRTIQRLINQIDTKQLQIPKHLSKISPQTEKLLQSLLTVDPRKRIEWNQLLQINQNTSPLYNHISSSNLFHQHFFALLFNIILSLFIKQKSNIELQQQIIKEIPQEIQQNQEINDLKSIKPQVLTEKSSQNAQELYSRHKRAMSTKNFDRYQTQPSQQQQIIENNNNCLQQQQIIKEDSIKQQQQMQIDNTNKQQQIIDEQKYQQLQIIDHSNKQQQHQFQQQIIDYNIKQQLSSQQQLQQQTNYTLQQDEIFQKNLRILLKKRNLIFFQSNLLFKILESQINAQQLSMKLINSINDEQQKLLELMNSEDQLKRLKLQNVEQFVKTQEFKAAKDMIKKETEQIQQVIAIFNRENQNNSQDEVGDFTIQLLNYLQNLRDKILCEKKVKNDKNVKKLLLLSIEVIDCFDHTQLFQNNLNENQRFDEQQYFQNLKNQTNQELTKLIDTKIETFTLLRA